MVDDPLFLLLTGKNVTGIVCYGIVMVVVMMMMVIMIMIMVDSINRER